MIYKTNQANDFIREQISVKLTMSTTLMESIDNTHKPIVTLTGGPKGAEWMCQTTRLVISLQKMNKRLFQCPFI